MGKILSELYQAISLIRPQVATSTVTGTGVQIDSGNEDDALAIVNLGAASDTDASCIVTIEGSDAIGGTYTVLTTFATLTATSDNKLAAGAVNLRGYSFVRAKATIAGTGTPSFAIDVVLLVNPLVRKSTLNSLTAA